MNRRFVRARWSLGVGTLLFVGLLCANIAAWFLPEEASRVDLRHEPPHSAILRRMMWSNPAADTVVGFMGSTEDSSAASVFSTVPAPIARVGRPYEYQPRATVPLAGFTLRGQPGGITVDPATGHIAGSADRPGRYQVVLEARIDDERNVRQRFPLFVDDRFLLLGADERGRDVLRRLLASARLTIVPALIAVLVGVAGGVILGALGGYYGGAARRTLTGLTAVLQSIPGLLIIFLAAVLSGFNLYVVMATVGIILLPETANGVCEQVESFRKRDFVEAARELGLRDRTILWNEIVWLNTRTFVLSRVTQGFVFAILVEITLTYMGLTQNSTSLGRMLLEGRNAWTGRESSAQGMATVAALLLLVATFSLLDRGIRGRWERRP